MANAVSKIMLIIIDQRRIEFVSALLFMELNHPKQKIRSISLKYHVLCYFNELHYSTWLKMKSLHLWQVVINVRSRSGSLQSKHIFEAFFETFHSKWATNNWRNIFEANSNLRSSLNLSSNFVILTCNSFHLVTVRLFNFVLGF